MFDSCIHLESNLGSLEESWECCIVIQSLENSLEKHWNTHVDRNMIPIWYAFSFKAIVSRAQQIWDTLSYHPRFLIMFLLALNSLEEDVVWQFDPALLSFDNIQWSSQAFQHVKIRNPQPWSKCPAMFILEDFPSTYLLNTGACSQESC